MALALAAAAWAADVLVWAAPFSAGALALAVVGRPIYPRRRRMLASGAGPPALLALVRPGATTSTLDLDGAEVGVLEDMDGLAAVIRVGDRSRPLGAALPALPALSALASPPARDVPEVRVQLLVSAVPAPVPSTAPSATSYRQLSSGRAPARQGVFVAVRVRRAGGFLRPDLSQSLVVALRRALRLLTRVGLPTEPLPAAALLVALAECAQHDPGHPARESWTAVQVGGLHQASYRVDHWPGQAGLIAGLLTLPTSATTVSLIAQPTLPPPAAGSIPAGAGRYGPEHDPPDTTLRPVGTGSGTGSTAAFRSPARAASPAWEPSASPTPPGGAWKRAGDPRTAAGSGRLAPNDIWAPADDGQVAGGGEWAVGTDGPAALAELVIRLAAPTTATLAQAEAALRRLGEALGAKVTRLDGAQLDGLAATLPLGGSAPTHEALLAGLLADQAGLALSGANPAHVTARHLAAIQPPIGIEGIMLGVNRHGAPVVVRLFRPTPTRVALIGGHRCAQVVVLRALATGARVVVLSGRPHAWEPFQRGTGAGEALAVLPPARLPDPPPATAMRPQLLVLDVGPVPAGTAPVPEGPWRTLLYVRDDLTEADAAMLGGADLALVQPLSPAEAELAGDALGLGESRGWLARIPAEMLGIVVNRRVVRWALLSTTPIEHQLTGGPAR